MTDDQKAPSARLAPGCHRSHPHEEMSPECEAKTIKARLDSVYRRFCAAPEYTQGVCNDGTTILRDGIPMTIEQILEDLRANKAALNITATIQLGRFECNTYDFVSTIDPERIIRVVRLVSEPDVEYDMVEFPKAYQAANPMCGELIEHTGSRFFAEGAPLEQDDLYRGKGWRSPAAVAAVERLEKIAGVKR